MKNEINVNGKEAINDAKESTNGGSGQNIREKWKLYPVRALAGTVAIRQRGKDSQGPVELSHDDKIKIGRGVNSLTTFTSTDSEDMKKIIIVESMNLIEEDIYTTYKDYYVGKYKNHYDNQCLFMSSVNTYFRELQREEILDPEFDNRSFVDVEKQRDAWLAIGKQEASDWSIEKVKRMTFKSNVFLAGDIKILDAMEDLRFTINME